MRNRVLCLSLLAFASFCTSLSAQQKPLSELTVDEIMQDPAKFIGTSPGNISWSRDGQSIFFEWNPEASRGVSTYRIGIDGGEAEKDKNRYEGWPRDYDENSDGSAIVYLKNGDIFIKNTVSGEEKQITKTQTRESNVSFQNNEIIAFTKENNLFTINLSDGATTQITKFDFEAKEGNSEDANGNQEQDDYLREEQAQTSRYLKQNRKNNRNRGKKESGQKEEKLDNRSFPNAYNFQLSPNGKYVSFTVFRRAENGAKATIVPDFLTQSGYTEDLRARPKVGGPRSYREIGIYNIEDDSYYLLDKAQLPGINDKPDYLADYPERQNETIDRTVSANDILWSENGRYTVVHFGAHDNKDRWIMKLDPNTGNLSLIDRQRDEAWVAGPGIGSENGSGVLDFLADGKTIYFQSEKTGYSHLYTHDLSTSRTRQLTKGEFEIYSPTPSKDGTKWYFTANQKHPGIRHFYSMPIKGGKMTQVTSMDGNNQVTLSPDESHLAIRYSYIDQPYELYVQKNEAGAKAKRLTKSQREDFKAYDWHQPDVITFKAEDGEDVHARIYKPENPNGAAVIFVHGAGYLQNVHYWWSTYFREYMFNNLLMAKGYTVLDIDYRASSGYGRDWRTGIYRYMGGKDLSDNIDGAKYLIREHNIDPKRVGMYGGSYGGFITLFGMFNHPDIIRSGAALRSVTDWAHYNHGYTSNILNTPVEDPIAFKRSSPIYFAEGLRGDLLIAHGMVDTNVHFQDVVRLAQRLIELKKDNWEMAVYPVEGHGFRTPSSWTDEYKRILKLFENTIGKK